MIDGLAAALHGRGDGRRFRADVIAEYKIEFFGTFGEFLGAFAKERSGRPETEDLAAIVEITRDKVMAVRERFIVEGSDTDTDWLDIISKMVVVCNAAHALRISETSQRASWLVSLSSKVLRKMKTAEEDLKIVKGEK